MQNSIYVKRQSTNVAFEGQGQPTYDVISIGTKHRPSITQFSNDQPLFQVKETKIETRASPRGERDINIVIEKQYGPQH